MNKNMKSKFIKCPVCKGVGRLLAPSKPKEFKETKLKSGKNWTTFIRELLNKRQ